MTPDRTGVWFTNRLQEDSYLTNVVAHNGSGVALGDVNGDGRADIFLCSLEGPNRLYRNLGDWRFEEVDPGAAACPDQLSTGAVLADVDGDRDLDLLVNGIAAGTRLFLNDGGGNWTESTESGLSRTASATSMALADIDGDGDLDLYCTHYIDAVVLADPTTRFGIARRGDQWEVTRVNGQSAQLPRWRGRFEVLPGGRVREIPEADGFYRNEGGGRFALIQETPGVFMDHEGKPVPAFRDWGLAVMFRDINRDGSPDFYVCNDNSSPDRVWINTGQGTFRALDPALLRHTSRSSMGVDFADLDRDTRDDFIVVDMLAREHARRMTQLVKDYPDPFAGEQPDTQPRFNRNTLLFGRSDGSFAEAAFLAGVAATDWSWCPIFLDVDLDGYEDLLVTTGFAFDVMDQDSHDSIRRSRLTEAQLKRSRLFHPPWRTKNAAFRNRGDGTFEPADEAWAFNHAGISYGMALADLDEDGDLDVVVNNLNEPASLYRNDAPAARIAVRLRGLAPNTEGIGARITLIAGGLAQSQEMICGGRYMSGDEPLRVFAAQSRSEEPMRLEVEWRDGTRSVLPNVQPNRIYEVHQPVRSSDAASAKADRAGAKTEPFFVDAGGLSAHTHRENPFDDWAQQPLLPRRLSRLGPGLSWFDVNGDGWEDLIVPAAEGSKLAVFLNEGGTGFKRIEEADPAPGDQGAAVGWPDGKGGRAFLVAVSRDAIGHQRESQIARYSGIGPSASAPTAATRLPLGTATGNPGPLALADVDGDGDLDLFVGGRYLPGRYPEPVSSSVWINEAGELRRSSEWSRPFESIGLVSGAAFADFDDDGDPDLVLATDCGPIRLFRNGNGRFTEVTSEAGLADTSGWWTGVVAGDFDGDGKIDLAAGNWGTNSSYELYRPGPLRLYYGDWNPPDNIEIIEAGRIGETWVPIRNRIWLERGMPEVKQRFSTHAAYAAASVEEMLGDRLAKAGVVEVSHLESTVFLNRGSRFEKAPLPREAQRSPVFSIHVGDFNGDGNEDLFLSQNFFGIVSELTRDDAGQGLWLEGNGKGGFRAVDPSVSGIRVDGEQRGAALADFNHDGRVDLAVSQNNGPVRLFVNRGGRHGLRVVLEGPPENPEGVGARMRVIYTGGRAGPSRVIQAGSGYWSQDGTAQILGLAEKPVALWVRMPGGEQRRIPLEESTHEIRVRMVREE